MTRYLIFLLIYLLPSLVAHFRKHRSRNAILFGNALLGWTGVGWLVFLAFSLSDNVELEDDNPLLLRDPEPPSELEEIPYDSETQKNEVEELFQSLREIAEDFSGELGQFCKQANAQLPILQVRYAKLHRTLERKLKPTEITYGRYHRAAAQVYDSVVANLQIVLSLFRSVDGIDTSHIEKRLKVLDNKRQLSQPDKDESETLHERMDLFHKQIEKISVLLTKNEVAITKLDRLNAELAQMNIVAGRVPTEFESSIREMEELVSRVQRYDETPVEWESKSNPNKDKIRS